jgi:hypothetical protein
LICFHTATSSIFSFFSWSRTCHDFISWQQQQDTQIKQSKEGIHTKGQQWVTPRKQQQK